MNSYSVVIITGSRAEYYLLQPVILKLEKISKITLKILVTGDHLKNQISGSFQDIRNSVCAEIYPLPIDTDNSTPEAVCNQVSQAVEQFGRWFQNNPCHLVIILGDRHEILAASTAALIHQIPIAHINGGDITEGAIDDCFRHSITKMSNYHFPATELSAKRICKMGELSENVFNVGSLGVENALNNALPSCEFTLIEKPFGLLTCHSETRSKIDDISSQQREVLEALKSYQGKILITQSNCDLGGSKINQIHQTWSSQYPAKFVLVNNLGWDYHTALQCADFCIGNSSSALIEAPALQTPSINIGIRQKGRERGNSVVQCDWSKLEIVNAIELCLNSQWLGESDRFSSPYQSSKIKTSDIIVDKIFECLKSLNSNKVFQLNS